MPTNNLEAAIQTSVKFYASLTRNQAKGVDAIGSDTNGDPIYVEPGAVCFVSDAAGNSIFLNTRLFGDGAIAGGGGGGGGGITEVNLSDLVVVQLNGQTLKTLADYFNADGDFITDQLTVYSTETNGNGEEYQVTAISINSTGITIMGSSVITEADLPAFQAQIEAAIAQDIATAAGTAEQNAKDYADTLIGSVYKVKGSVENYSALSAIQNPKGGDVYNVVAGYSTMGQPDYIAPGTNYVYVDSGNGTGYWDPLGGTINLSAYKTAADTTAEIGEAETRAKTYADGLKQAVDGDISQINTTLLNHGQGIANNQNAISGVNTIVSGHTTTLNTHTTNINNIVTQLTWQ